jgi:hypothetical protein
MFALVNLYAGVRTWVVRILGIHMSEKADWLGFPLVLAGSTLGGSALVGSRTRFAKPPPKKTLSYLTRRTTPAMLHCVPIHVCLSTEIKLASSEGAENDPGYFIDPAIPTQRRLDTRANLMKVAKRNPALTHMEHRFSGVSELCR